MSLADTPLLDSTRHATVIERSSTVYHVIALSIVTMLGLLVCFRLSSATASSVEDVRRNASNARQALIATLFSVVGYAAAIKLIPRVAEACLNARSHLWGKDINKRVDVKVYDTPAQQLKSFRAG